MSPDKGTAEVPKWVAQCHALTRFERNCLFLSFLDDRLLTGLSGGTEIGSVED